MLVREQKLIALSTHIYMQYSQNLQRINERLQHNDTETGKIVQQEIQEQ